MALNGVSFHETPDVISAARLIEVPQSTVCLVCWEQTAPDGQLTPYYAISLDGENMATVRPTSYELKLQHSQFDPLGRIPAVETDLAADEDSQIYIVQFVTQPLEQFRTAIEARGGTLYKYIANHAYLVKLGPQATRQSQRYRLRSWLGPYHPAYRLEHFLRANRGDAGQLFPMQRYNILLFEREGAGRGGRPDCSGWAARSTCACGAVPDAGHAYAAAVVRRDPLGRKCSSSTAGARPSRTST